VREVLNSTRRIDCRKAFDSQMRGCGAARGGAFWRGVDLIHCAIPYMVSAPPHSIPRRLRPPAYGTPNKKKSSPGLSNRPCGLGPTAHLSILNTEAERIPVISNKINQNQSDATTQRPVPPKDQKQTKNKSPNVSQSISHVPAASTQASKHRGYCSFIAVSSSGVGHGASLASGCCLSSMRAKARKAGHHRSVALCGC
jgi:hypothetical protein